MIVDFHTHVDDIPALGWHLPADAVLAQLDEAGIDQAVVMTIVDTPALRRDALEILASTCASSGGRLHPFARVHPWYDEAPGMLEHALDDLGFRGVKLHGVSTLAHPGEEPVLRLLRIAADRGVPVMFHSGDDPFTTPLELADAARAVPDVAVVLAHIGGFGHTEDAIAVAEALPNVYLDTSAMPYPAAIADAVDRAGPDRVLFGSDAPGCPAPLELAKVRLAGLAEDDLDKVLGGNALRLLR
ncbi:amidohydrolase family protein [Pseudonocardia spinosispora]|uniref:amidohydrolase family protein n=1 Tax=Pseudonocardia spinosispora TaxID=103441 RepID=UPI0003FCE3B0|nr:amidohydrolase family protein [Pseudonocardia spinosispora]